MSDRFTRGIYLTLAEGRELSADDARHLAGCATCQAAAARAGLFEGAFHRELANLRVPMPADPLAVTETSPSSRSLVPGLTIGLVVLLAGMLGSGLLAAPDADPSPETTVTPVASAPPSTPSPPAPAATPELTPVPQSAEATPDEAIEPGVYAVAPLSTALPVYDGPDGTPFGEAVPGSELYVISVVGDWVQAQLPVLPLYDQVFGWVRAPTLNRHAPSPCLDVPPGSHVWFGGHPQRALECYGRDGQLVVRGYAIDATRQDPPAYGGDPAWLAERSDLELSSVIGPAANGFSVQLHLPPDLVGTVPLSDREGFEGTLLELTGHFDDPRSSGCALTPVAEGYPPVDEANAELWCRQRLVVDAVVIVEPEN